MTILIYVCSFLLISQAFCAFYQTGHVENQHRWHAYPAPTHNPPNQRITDIQNLEEIPLEPFPPAYTAVDRQIRQTPLQRFLHNPKLVGAVFGIALAALVTFIYLLIERIRNGEAD